MANKDYRDETLALLVGDARERLRDLPDGSIQCVVTSPPYFGLRDYGVAGQIGLESSLDAYIESLVDVFREVRRVLRDDGTVWLNLGDSYANTGGSAKRQIPHGDGRAANTDHYLKERVAVPGTAVSKSIPNGIKPKELIGVPWRVAFALQADGWFLRADIVWAKKNPMPESVKDRPTRSHEFIFLLTKSPRYYYDAEAIKEPSVSSDVKRSGANAFRGQRALRPRGVTPIDDTYAATRNRRDVWTIATRPFRGAHFATFPPDLVEPCVLAGSSARGQCPDCGTPWSRTDAVPSVASNGWVPGCGCGSGLLPDDLVVIPTPTGERVAEDPSIRVGRAGYNRPRGENEGQRPITRYEQRAYAAQLRASEHREKMAAEAGSAFAHYIRTDYPNGARPVPQELLDLWIGRGWLIPVVPPTPTPPQPVPQIVLDPFGGAGTTALVANKHGRRAVLVELNPDYARLTLARLGRAKTS